MTDAITLPLAIAEGPYRYTRARWGGAGQDDFIQPPSQNPDSFTILNNMLPPIEGVLQRRFGYAAFAPKLEFGVAGPGDDSISSAAIYGVDFDGLGGYVSTDVSASLNPDSATIEFWFASSSTAGGYLVSFNTYKIWQATGDTQTFGIYLNTTGTLQVGVNNGSINLSVVTGATFNDGNGHHVVVTLDGTNMLLYVDGVLQRTMALSGGTALTGYWRFACGSGSAGWPPVNFLQTFLSDVSIYTTHLTATQVLSDYDAMIINGSQGVYQAAIAANGPHYFWYLTEPPLDVSVTPFTSNVAYDHADANNGLYNYGWSPNNVTPIPSGDTAPTWVTVVTPATVPINVGDTGIMMLNIQQQATDPDLPIVLSMTDSAGNTWKPLTPPWDMLNGYNPSLFQLWYANMATAIPLTHSLTISFTVYGMPQGLNAGCDFCNFPNVGAPVQINGAQGFGGTEPYLMSSGGIKTTQTEVLLTACLCSNSIVTYPWSFNPAGQDFMGTSGGYCAMASWAIAPFGTYIDEWTTEASDAPWAAVAVGFPIKFGSTLGAYIILP